MVLARILSPAEFGIVTASLVISGFGLIFTEIGVGPSIVQKKNITVEHIKAGFFISAFISIVMAYSVNEFKNEISELFNIKDLAGVIPYLALIYLLRGLTVVSEALLQRKHEFKKISIIEFISYSLGYGVTSIILAYQGYSYWSLIIAQLVQTIIPLIPVFKIAPYKELLYFGVGFTAAKIANYVANQSDKFIISRYLGESALGLYGRSYQLAVMPINLIGRVLDKVTFPIMSEMQGDERKLKTGYEKLLISASFMAFPLSCILFILSDEIVLFVLGDKWLSVTTIFQIMVFGLVFKLAFKISDSMLKALGKVYKLAVRQTVYAFAVSIFCFVGAHYSINWVAVGLLLAGLLNTFMMVQLCLKETKNSWLETGRYIFYGYRFALIASMPVFLIDILLEDFIAYVLFELVLLVGVWLLSIFLMTRYIPEIVFRESGMVILNSIFSLFPGKIRKFFPQFDL